MTASTSQREPASGVRGILAPAARLDRWLLVVLVVLLGASAMRYLDRHGLDAAGVAVLAGALVLGLAYATRGLLTSRTWWPTAWVTGMVLLWGALTTVAPSFAWCAVPVAFAALRVLPLGWAIGTVVLMTGLLTVAWQRISDDLDPVRVAGPIGVALVTVLAYRTLDLESRARQGLLDQLVDVQDELAEQQRRIGALAERTRLSREIHDSVGQGLSSINLLLQAAEQDWDARPIQARAHVGTAASTTRDGLDEVRRVVADLAPADLADDDSPDSPETGGVGGYRRAGRVPCRRQPGTCAPGRGIGPGPYRPRSPRQRPGPRRRPAGGAHLDLPPRRGGLGRAR